MADVPPTPLRQCHTIMHNLRHVTALLRCRITMRHLLRTTTLLRCRITMHRLLRTTALLRCHITMHRLLRTTTLLRCRITMHRLLRTTTQAAVGILLQTATAAAERHDLRVFSCHLDETLANLDGKRAFQTSALVRQRTPNTFDNYGNRR
jgi:hypothetical protein